MDDNTTRVVYVPELIFSSTETIKMPENENKHLAYEIGIKGLKENPDAIAFQLIMQKIVSDCIVIVHNKTNQK